jgi:hypothetical protein
MAMDAKLEFSDAQALANKSSGASTVATNIVDMRTGLKDTWGTAKAPDISDMVWNVNVNTALVGAGAAIVATLVTKASASSISSGGTVIAQVTIPALSAAGIKKAVKMPTGQKTLRYVGVYYTASGAKLTSAKFDSWLGLDNEYKS